MCVCVCVWTAVIWSSQSLVSVNCRHLNLAVPCEHSTERGCRSFSKYFRYHLQMTPDSWVACDPYCHVSFCARCMCTETHSCIYGEKLQWLMLKMLCATVQNVMCHCTECYVPLYRMLCATVQNVMCHCTECYVSLYRMLCATVQNVMCHCTECYVPLYRMLCATVQNVVARATRCPGFNRRLPLNLESVLISWTTVSFSRKALLRGVISPSLSS